MGRSKKSFQPGIASQNVKFNIKWVFVTLAMTFLFSVGMSATSASIMSKAHILVAFVVLFMVISIGVVFDIIGVAVATATETSFHSLAARQVKGAKESVRIIRAAPAISSFCNDVVGDVSGIVSGSSVGVIVLELVGKLGLNGVIISLVLTGIVAALTVGLKALGKGFAMMYNNKIVFFVGKLVCYFKVAFFIKR